MPCARPSKSSTKRPARSDSRVPVPCGAVCTSLTLPTTHGGAEAELSQSARSERIDAGRRKARKRTLRQKVGPSSTAMRGRPPGDPPRLAREGCHSLSEGRYCRPDLRVVRGVVGPVDRRHRSSRRRDLWPGRCGQGDPDHRAHVDRWCPRSPVRRRPRVHPRLHRHVSRSVGGHRPAPAGRTSRAYGPLRPPGGTTLRLSTNYQGAGQRLTYGSPRPCRVVGTRRMR